MVRFDGNARPAGERNALDHVGIKRALCKERCAADFVGLLIEHIDKELADNLALLLRIGDSGQFLQEHRAGIHMNKRDMIMLAEKGHDLLALAFAHHACIDENACQLIANRFVNQYSSDSAIHAAGQTADHFSCADLCANLRDLSLTKRLHAPIRAKATDFMHEVGKKLFAI